MTANLGSKARHRIRVALACDSCRCRKTRCDGQKPACGSCAALGEECFYQPQPNSSSYQFEVINRRLAIIENELVEIRANNSNKSSVPQAEQISFQQNQTIPFPTFNDRLARMKSHTSGNEESPTVYISGVFFSILSPSDITNLSRRLGDLSLGQKLESLSHGVWKSMQFLMSRIIGPTGEFSPDGVFLEKCKEIYGLSHSPFVHPLVPVDIFERDSWSKVPGQMQQGVFAAIVIYAGESMRFSSDYGPFSRDFVISQVQGAYCQAIRTLNLIHFSSPTFQQVRISVLLVWLLSVFSSVPALFHFLDPLLNMAMAIGLHRSDVNYKFPPYEAESREYVWFLATSMHYSFSIYLSRKPFVCQHRFLEAPRKGLNDFEISLFERNNALHEIYKQARDILFCGRRKKCNSDETFRDIVALDEEIERWRLSTPEGLLRLYTPNDMTFEEYINKFPSGNLVYKYCYTVICIHSIPALCPEYLSRALPDSLKKISEAARLLLDVTFTIQKFKRGCTPLNGIAITTAICIFLYKQLCYPDDQSNHKDVKLVQAHLHEFKNEIWPSSGEPHALVETWKFLTDMMEILQSQEVGSKMDGLSPLPEFDELLPEYLDQNSEQCIIS